jgi:outer membrane protein W
MASKVKLCSKALLFVILVFISTPSFSDIGERYHLSLGANLEAYNSGLSTNINGGDSIDFEDILGLDKQVNAGWFSGWYRVGDKHRVKLTYIPIIRKSTIQSDQDIVFNDTTISAGASISTKASTEIVDFSYIYSMHKTKQLEVGLSLGIYSLLNSTKIIAQGEIIADGSDQPTFKADYFSEQKLQAPMPLIGASVDYEFSPDWRIHASIRYLSLQVNEINGRIVTAELGAEYYFSDNWGAGASISSFDLDLKVNSLIANTQFQWEHNGVQIYVIFKY